MFRQVVLLAFCVRAAAGWCEDAAPTSYALDQCHLAERAQADGRWLDARNAWVRALSWDDVTDELPPAARSDAARQKADADARWRVALASSTPEIAPVPRSTRSHRRKSADTGATAEEIMARARAARDAGQLESALRLYRLAAKRPGGERATGPAAEIAAEMGEPQVER